MNHLNYATQTLPDVLYIDKMYGYVVNYPHPHIHIPQQGLLFN